MSKLVAALCNKFAVKRHCTSAYHPQTNVSCERMNSTVGQALRAYVKDDQSDWPSMLPLPGISMAYCMTPAMRSTDVSPYFLVFGHDMLTPIDNEIMPQENVPKTYKQNLNQTIENLCLARSLAKENINRNKDRNKEAYDANSMEPYFKEGQTVLLYTPQVQKGLLSKLQRKWKGPYYIVQCCQNHTYSLRHADTDVLHKPLVHANRLKPFTENSTPQGVESMEDSGQTEQEVDRPADMPQTEQLV